MNNSQTLKVPEALAQVTLERDGHRCRHSGDTENIAVYYIDPSKITARDELSNLITLSERMYQAAQVAVNDQSSVETRCGIILAGGRGTRLAPLTCFANKHELPVGGVPMIFRPLFTLRSMGIRDVLVTLDRENAPDRFFAMLGDGSEFGMSITYRVQQGAGGIAAALALAKQFVNGRESYVILGDNIFDENEFADWKHPNWWEELRRGDGACVFVKQVPNPRDYGIVEQHEGAFQVNRIIEKPENPPTNLAVVGLYIYPPSVFNIVHTLKPSGRNELEITDVNNYFGSKGSLTSREVKGFWGDAGGGIDLFFRVNEHMIRSR